MGTATPMTPTLLYRIASGLLVLFAAGHTFGFLKFKAQTTEVEAVRKGMEEVSFKVGGKAYTYGGFYRGFGLYITVYLLFSAYLACHLGTMAQHAPAAIGLLGWMFCAVQLAGLVLSWKYFFPITAVFSALVAVLTGWAAWLG